jgi:hypothetical protein
MQLYCASSCFSKWQPFEIECTSIAPGHAFQNARPLNAPLLCWAIYSVEAGFDGYRETVNGFKLFSDQNHPLNLLSTTGYSATLVFPAVSDGLYLSRCAKEVWGTAQKIKFSRAARVLLREADMVLRGYRKYDFLAECNLFNLWDVKTRQHQCFSGRS